MVENSSGDRSSQPRRTFGQSAKQAGLFILFGTILMIPRIRRLRRRVWAWICVRLVAASCGGWLVWRFAHSAAGAATLAGGLALLAFSLMARAKPAVKSVDDSARELGALIVLSGGIFHESPDSTPVKQAQILVHPERIIVLGRRGGLALEIPLAKVRDLAAHPVTNGAGEGASPWEVEIKWGADGPRTTTFRYDGAFAEHLARVTESTLRSQWIKDLPIISR